MNRVPRLPVPQHDHYATLRYTVLTGGGEETIGPFETIARCRKAVAAAQAPYPGEHHPSARIYSVERS